MLQVTLHLIRSSLWTFQLLRFEVFQVQFQKKNTATVSIGIQNATIFDHLMINIIVRRAP
jgi:hypothetical protein